MGKRRRKKDLLNEIQRERSALDETLALLPARQMTRAGVTRGGWSVKDVLAHLVEWQQMNLDWYAAGKRQTSYCWDMAAAFVVFDGINVTIGP